jgi:hypothetical protein
VLWIPVDMMFYIGGEEAGAGAGREK